MTNNIKAARGRTRGVSPALSVVSELTVLSRSPSPVPDYGGFRLLREKTQGISSASSDTSGPTASSPSSEKLRSPNGRFVARHTRRAPSSSPERPAKRPRRLTTSQQKANLKRAHKYAEPTSPMPEPASPIAWVAGKGGLGALEKLPMEIRQEIYAYAFNTSRPVTLKSCCGLTSTTRERDACRKHGSSTGIGTGRFNTLQVSKAMREEAMWVIFNQGSLSLSTTNPIAPYIEGCRSKSQRSVADFIQNDKWKSAMWNTAGQFRFTTIDVPENMVQYGDPVVFTQRLLGIATLLCKEEQHQAHTVKKSVHVHLGSVFHQILPFNMESQGEARYGELLDWLCVNYPTHDPDLDKITLESEHNLQRFLAIVGKHSGHSQWRIFAKTQIDEKDEGGAKALFDFQIGCARNGVVFEQTKCSFGTSYWK